jgi:hypothetical protein
VDDARDDAPVVNTAGARLVLRQMRLYHRPLRIAQPKSLFITTSKRFNDGSESDLRPRLNMLIGF